jgi:hypothetical protein
VIWPYSRRPRTADSPPLLSHVKDMVLGLSEVVIGVKLGFDPAREFGQEDAAWFGEFL